jgi:hypothetical protein
LLFEDAESAAKRDLQPAGVRAVLAAQPTEHRAKKELPTTNLIATLL